MAFATTNGSGRMVNDNYVNKDLIPSLNTWNGSIVPAKKNFLVLSDYSWRHAGILFEVQEQVSVA